MNGTRICSVDGCEKNARPKNREAICSMHRERIRRHGSPEDPRKPREQRFKAKGYWMVYAPDHPLLTHWGYIGEHRVVLYEKIGPGEHACTWCHKTISWNDYRWDGIIADHLNRNTEDNRPENLVPSCNTCNVQRRHWERTHCKDGHELTAENTYNLGNRRRCRTCMNSRQRDYQRRKREKLIASA